MIRAQDLPLAVRAKPVLFIFRYVHLTTINGRNPQALATDSAEGARSCSCRFNCLVIASSCTWRAGATPASA